MSNILLIVFTVLFMAVILFNKEKQFDPSVSEVDTSPPIKTKASYSKAFVHFVTALALYLLMVVLGLNPFLALIPMAVGIPGWEWSQGFWNKTDIWAGAAGTVTGLVAVLVGAFIIMA